MGTQVIDFNNIDRVVFDGQELEALNLNNVNIWTGFIKLGQLIDRSIESVTAEDLEGVTNIGQYSFSSCALLNSVELPNSVTKIDTRAFENCSQLTEITIPSGVTTIGDYALSGYSTRVKMLPTNPPSIYNQPFGTLLSGSLVIEVPASSLSAYQSADKWSNYAKYMVGV